MLSAIGHASCTEAGRTNFGRRILRYADPGRSGRSVIQNFAMGTRSSGSRARPGGAGLKVYDDRDVGPSASDQEKVAPRGNEARSYWPNHNTRARKSVLIEAYMKSRHAAAFALVGRYLMVPGRNRTEDLTSKFNGKLACSFKV